MAHRSRAHRAVRSQPRRSTRSKFRALTGRDPAQVGEIRVEPKRLPSLTQAALPHYWHPDRVGVVTCEREDPSFHKKLIAVHRDLRLCRPPVNAPVPKHFQCWTLWVRKAEVRHPLCPGWQLLMPWAYMGRALPLDERIFAAIAHFDRRHLGENAVQYFDRLVRENQREKESAEKKYRDHLVQDAKEWMESTKIKNIGSGSKFAMHHDGTVMPSRGEQNWTREREKRMLPKRVLQDMERRRDR